MDDRREERRGDGRREKKGEEMNGKRRGAQLELQGEGGGGVAGNFPIRKNWSGQCASESELTVMCSMEVY